MRIAYSTELSRSSLHRAGSRYRCLYRISAEELANLFNELFGGVRSAAIDTDAQFNYPKGAARVTFATRDHYCAAIKDRFVHIRLRDLDKRVRAHVALRCAARHRDTARHCCSALRPECLSIRLARRWKSSRTFRANRSATRAPQPMATTSARRSRVSATIARRAGGCCTRPAARASCTSRW